MQIKLETHQIYLTWQVKCLLYKIDSIDPQNQVRVEAENCSTQLCPDLHEWAQTHTLII